MSTFTVSVVPIKIEQHPDPDVTALEIARIGDYISVVRKGQFATGDLVAYIPEAAILPEDILAEMNLTGRLAGPQGNRVKAIRLRGVLSQGICYPARYYWNAGDDVSEELGIKKWEPPIPAAMAGEVWFAGGQRTLKYDIENIKKYPNILFENEPVVMTEKVHGTFGIFGLLPKSLESEQGRVIVSSKGLSAQGLAFKLDVEANINNLYIRTNMAYRITDRIAEVAWETFDNTPTFDEPVFVLGEVFGQGIQDLSYGASASSNAKIGFRVFDIYIGHPGTGHYLNDLELSAACMAMGLERVPVLYRGPFTHSALELYTNGTETISGSNIHLREGCVIRPTVERKDQTIGRVQFKSVSEAYLLRKNGTELN